MALCLWVCIDVVLLAATLEQTPSRTKLADELPALHAGIAIGLDRARR